MAIKIDINLLPAHATVIKRDIEMFMYLVCEIVYLQIIVINGETKMFMYLVAGSYALLNLKGNKLKRSEAPKTTLYILFTGKQRRRNNCQLM